VRTLSRHRAEPARAELMSAHWRLGRGRLLWAILAATTVAAASMISNGSALAGTPQMPVTGYAQADTPAGQVAASAAGLATLGVDGVDVSTSGTTVPPPDAPDLSLLYEARKFRLQAELLIGNYSDRLGGSDPTAAHALLSSPSNIDRMADTLARLVASQGWTGILLDLESLDAGDRAGLVAFVRTLGRRLPAGRTVSVAVTAFTSAEQYTANGYDLRQLGRLANRIVLMAYDEHGPTWSGPGPIGGLPWQQAVLRPVLALVPAGRIDLGVAGYGYTWPERGTGAQFSDASARQLVRAAGSTALWNARQGEWTATLPDGTVIWWSDARSWRLRVALARSYHLHGLALWSLGLSDPLPRRHAAL
jgi:spore germination protein